ncbi:hypothetical protein OIU79_023036 [Salix purpurea]|uniref:Uncharacterized protein n=1 Tax=Salix purpurea TaxID=77065 RepID=A0A9Q0WH75_SALPP|nr:hypothetical protein OIU79_023036 [Salix purpurea]
MSRFPFCESNENLEARPSSKFRLGLEVASGYCEGCIREAKTDAFTVTDHRDRMRAQDDKSCPPTVYKKHYPPALNDEVWRLEKIETESSTQMTLFLTIRSLVKRAYDNWMHVIEYDGRSLPDLKQNQGFDAISLPLQNLLVNTSRKIQAPGTDNLNNKKTAQPSQPSEFTTVRVLELEEKQLQKGEKTTAEQLLMEVVDPWTSRLMSKSSRTLNRRACPTLRGKTTASARVS